jgi:hypothetical protein
MPYDTVCLIKTGILFLFHHTISHQISREEYHRTNPQITSLCFYVHVTLCVCDGVMMVAIVIVLLRAASASQTPLENTS